MRLALLASLALCFYAAAPAQSWPQTKAEKTAYRETSSHQEVLAFIEELQRLSAPFRMEFIGISEEGRKIPMVIVSDSPVAGPADARRSGKAIVYIQANIHGGEVEGKEASLQLMREFALMLDAYRNPHLTPTPELFRLRRILDECVLLFVPIYNADGNDNFGDGMRNRGSQDGPEIVGTRPNGQGFDLNRDCIKADSHEMRAVLNRIYTTWDPDVVMDLHTTNGTRHGYQLTYAPPMSPITETGILKYSREELLPRLRSGMRSEHGFELFDYGNATRRGETRRWETFGVEGRYVSTYVGLRNRIGILSEATSYLAFKDRVAVTHAFVLSILIEVARDKERIIELTRGADERVVQMGIDAKYGKSVELGVRFEMKSRGIEDVLLEVAQPVEPVARNKAPKEIEKVQLEVFDRFIESRTAKFPGGYLFSAEHKDVAELLIRHGIVVERLLANATVTADYFMVTESIQGQQPFQGRRLIRLEGEHTSRPLEASSGWFYVDTAQPLGILAFYLLEPEGLDGAIAWGFFGLPEAGKAAPVFKVFSPMKVPREQTTSLQEIQR
jgi:hypothetical protein